MANVTKNVSTSVDTGFILPKVSAELYALTPEKFYNPRWEYKNNKWRRIEAPNDVLKEWQREMTELLQSRFQSPIYNFSAWKGLNNVGNANAHAGANYFLTADISHFYENTQAKWIKKFAKKELHLKGKHLETFMAFTVFENHLPTGSPTSPILSMLVHKELFDIIYNAMEKQGIKFTLYVDDMTFSSNKPIPNNTIKYVKNVLKTHGLFLKASKIKRFGYKGAHITGIKTTQSGKLEMPFKKGHEIKKILQDKAIKEMSLKELRGLISKIGYIQQIYPKDMKKKPFYVAKYQAIKQLKKLETTERTENKNANRIK